MTVESHDDDYGTLYTCEVPFEEPLVFVRVKNSTPEADGSRENTSSVFLPISPQHMRQLLWTFQMRPEKYKPTVET